MDGSSSSEEDADSLRRPSEYDQMCSEHRMPNHHFVRACIEGEVHEAFYFKSGK